MCAVRELQIRQFLGTGLIQTQSHSLPGRVLPRALGVQHGHPELWMVIAEVAHVTQRRCAGNLCGNVGVAFNAVRLIAPDQRTRLVMFFVAAGATCCFERRQRVLGGVDVMRNRVVAGHALLVRHLLERSTVACRTVVADGKV